MNELLKPCPFCGGKAELITLSYGMGEKYTVRCKRLHCRGRTRKPVGAKHVAVRDWNWRAAL